MQFPLWLELVVLALAVWRVSHMLVDEDGPGDMIHKLRMLTGISYTEQFEPLPHRWSPLWCVACTSMWVALCVVTTWLLVPHVAIVICIAFALSAVAIFIERRLY